jgi:hypothetical protein
MVIRSWNAVLTGYVVAACGTCPPPPVAPEPPGTQPRHDLTCEEQVLQLQPIPTGEYREYYVRQCLLEHEFRAFVGERQSCSQDDDCVLVRTFCPFGTAVSVAQRYAGDVSAKYDALASEYAKFASCKYKGIARGDTKCTTGRCDFVGGKSPFSR